MAGVAVALGAIPMLVGSEPYLATARFGLREASVPQIREVLNRELVDYLAAAFGELPDARRLSRWEVLKSPAPDSLGVVVVAASRPAARSAADELARGFLGRLKRQSRGTGLNETAAEATLARVAESLREQVSSALRDTANGATNGDAVADRRDELAAQVRQWRTDFHALQDELGRVEARRAEMLSGDDSRVTISAEQRREAFESDAGLSEDLAELDIRIGDLRIEMISVDSACQPLMEGLGKAVAALQAAAGTRSTDPLGAAKQAQVDRIAELTDQFERARQAFSGEWSKLLSPLSHEATGAATPAGVLAANESLARLVGDFLYEAGVLLTQMRAALREFEQTGSEGGSTGPEQARLQSAATGLAPAFHSMQAAFHRYDFAASKTLAASNFRLDAALKASRGLHRRVQQAMQAIEQRLTAEAQRQAESTRESELRAIDQSLADLRGRMAERVHELLALQDELIANHVISEEFIRRTAHADGLRAGADGISRVLSDLSGRLDSLADQRVAWSDPAALTYLGCTVERAPIDLGRRILTGWLVASATLGALVAIPWGWRHIRRPGR